MDWSKYRLVIETVDEKDGGGYRAFFPTLGYSVYGSGDTLAAMMVDLEDSKRATEVFMAETPDYTLPAPTGEDLMSSSGQAANNNFAYAA